MYLWLYQAILVIQALVGRTAFATTVFVHVLLDTMVMLTLAVDQNVCIIQTVR